MRVRVGHWQLTNAATMSVAPTVKVTVKVTVTVAVVKVHRKADRIGHHIYTHDGQR